MTPPLIIADEAQMLALGARLAAVSSTVETIGLRGDLGAGKTTVVRGLLRALGVPGSIKSPTFSLVEVYELPGRSVYHFDFYRLNKPDELEHIGLRDYFSEHSLCLIEWPEKATGLLPLLDIDVIIQKVNGTRRVQFESHTKAGSDLLNALT